MKRRRCMVQPDILVLISNNPWTLAPLLPPLLLPEPCKTSPPVPHPQSSLSFSLPSISLPSLSVLTAASLYSPRPNILYTEGFALDEFCAGMWGLRPFLPQQGSHKIGLILDAGMEEDMRLRHVQVADGARAALGVDVGAVVVTEEPMEVGLGLMPGGGSWGKVGKPGTLLRAARRLVEEGGCTALAVVARFPEEEEEEEALQAYREGHGVDCVGGAEAVISHLVTRELRVPCAHAPGLPPLEVDAGISPKACGEELGYTFLPCVLANLNRAPLLVVPPPSPATSASSSLWEASTGGGKEGGRGGPRGDGRTLWREDVSAVIAPASAIGGPAVLSLLGGGRETGQATLLIAVEENETLMKTTPEELLPRQMEAGRVVRVKTYLEAMGLLAAHRAGLNPAALTATVPRVRVL